MTRQPKDQSPYAPGRHPWQARLAAMYARLFPGSSKAWLLYSSFSYYKGDDTYEGILREGVHKNPKSVPLVTELAWFLLFRNRRDEAMTITLRTMEQNPDAPEPYVTLATDAAQRESWVEAFEALRKAEARILQAHEPIETNERIALAILQMARAEQIGLFEETGSELRGWAIKALTRSASTSTRWSVFLLLSLLLEQEGRAEAERTMREAKRLWPGDNDAFLLEVERWRWLLSEDSGS